MIERFYLQKHALNQILRGGRQTALAAAMTILCPTFFDPPIAAEQEPTAYVTDMSKRCSTGFAVRDPTVSNQQQSKCPINYFSALYEGDQLIISNPNDWLVLWFGGDRTIRLEPKDSPYNVPGATSWIEAFDRFLSSVFELLGPSPTLGKISAVSRGTPGGPLETPIFDIQSSLVMAAGKRPFALEWNGGVPPFRVEIARDGVVELVDSWPDIRVQGLDPQQIDFTPGGYQIFVRDLEGNRKSVELEIIKPSELPRLAAYVSTNGENADILELATIASLVSQNEAWRLESYIRAIELAKQYPAAKILADRLADGRPIHLTAP